MITFLATTGHHKPIERYLETWGKALAKSVTRLTYEQVSRRKSLHPGTYIFADIERLPPRQAESAARVWNHLAGCDCETRLLNHPTRSRRRYSLLRHLFDRGINQFNAYHLTEGRLPQRYPVFVRGENDHKGSGSQLLRSYEALEKELANRDRLGLSHEDTIITEFCDTADEAGVYRKYSAFVVGGTVIPRHVFFSQGWIVKRHELVKPVRVREDRMLEEEWEYVCSNPHEAELKKIFELARIDYGRIDYSFAGERMQVWEINTNPTIGSFLYGVGSKQERVNEYFCARFNTALNQINLTKDAGRSIKLPRSTAGKKRGARRAKGIVHGCLRTCNLLEYEDGIYRRLGTIKRRLRTGRA